MRVEQKTYPAGQRMRMLRDWADRGALAGGMLAGQLRASAFATTDDITLFVAVTALNLDAVEEVYDLHASALCSLALCLLEDPELAMQAVAGAFIALWQAPQSIDLEVLEEQGLRAVLAGEVRTRCTQAREQSLALAAADAAS